jgi:cytochrome P450
MAIFLYIFMWLIIMQKRGFGKEKAMTVWVPNDDGQADLTSHDSFTQGPPHNTFARLRRDDPMHWTPWDKGLGFWSVTRHADILALNGQPDLLSSARGIRMEDQSHEEYLARRTFQETDAPDHMMTRVKVAKAFSKPVMAGYEQAIRDLCVEILDAALEKGTFDATKEIARQLPMRMLGRIVGLPEQDLPWLVEKGDALIANTDPDFTAHVLDKMTTDEFRMMPFNSPAGAELFVYAKDLMAKKAAAGDTSGVLHLILQPGSDGTVMPEHEFRNFFCLIVAAGNDTTRYSIAAGIQALANQPGLLQQIQSGAVTDTMADEIIRWATPTSYFRRTATRDFDMHGKTVRAGDKVLYWFASGNRDEAAFADPFRVDLARSPNKHVAFGQGGPHVCLGMWLARLEVRVLFQELARRLRSIEPAGAPQFLRSNFIGGIKSLPVRVTLQ